MKACTELKRPRFSETAVHVGSRTARCRAKARAPPASEQHPGFQHQHNLETACSTLTAGGMTGKLIDATSMRSGDCTTCANHAAAKHTVPQDSSSGCNFRSADENAFISDNLKGPRCSTALCCVQG